MILLVVRETCLETKLRREGWSWQAETLGVPIFLLGHLLSGLAGQGRQEGSEAKRTFLPSFWTSHFLNPLLRDFHLQRGEAVTTDREMTMGTSFQEEGSMRSHRFSQGESKGLPGVWEAVSESVETLTQKGGVWRAHSSQVYRLFVLREFW